MDTTTETEVDDGYGGDCFQVAMGLALEDYRTIQRLCGGEGRPIVLNEKSPFRIVHGTPIGVNGPPKGKRYWHAWVEYTNPPGAAVPVVVLDYSNGHNAKLDRDMFYRIGQLDESVVFRYTIKEAQRLYRKHGHCGPWVPNAHELEDPEFREIGWANA